MHISFVLHWYHGKNPGQAIEPELFQILSAIHKSGSLKRAAETTGFSYRHCWGLIKKWQEKFNVPLVSLKRGRSQDAQLTDFGHRLVEEESKLTENLAPTLKDHALQVEQRLKIYATEKKQTNIRLSASHDLAISYLIELLNKKLKQPIQYQTKGSLENLRLLANSQCDIAGFHYPLQELHDGSSSEYLQWLKRKSFRLVQVSIRQQGLMIQKNNPKKIRTIADLTKRSVRYINRQAYSGTRIIFDGLIKQAGISASDINGYPNEEFTHLAVAAMIASGAADAGMGLKAAASEFGLGFIPLIDECYMMAFDPGLDPQITDACIDRLKSRGFKHYINKLPGYDASQAGRILVQTELFAGH